MPAVAVYDNRDLNSDQEKIHQEYFEKTLKVGAALRGLRDWYEKEIPIPADLDILCVGLGASNTNKLLRRLQERYATKEQVASNHMLDSAYGNVMYWYRLADKIGEPRWNDDPFQYQLHDLILLIERGELTTKHVMDQIRIAIIGF